MATDAGLPALSARLTAIGKLYSGDMTPAGHAVGKGARVEANSVARDVTGGDQVLSRMGRKGSRLGMRYDLEQQGRTVIVKLVPAGPWVLTEKGAKPHTIPRSTSRRRSAKPRYLFAAGYSHPVRGPIDHPGTQRTQTGSIRRAMGRMRARAPRDFHDAYVEQLAKVMA